MLPFCSTSSMADAERKGFLSNGNIASKDISVDSVIVTRDWMWDIGIKLGISYRAILGSINIFDAYVSREDMLLSTDLVASACASMTLSSKYNEVVLFSISDYARLNGSGVAEDIIVDFEDRIFITLGCNINIPIDANYLRVMDVFSFDNAKVSEQCNVVLLLLSVKPTRFLPSVVVTTVRALISDEDDYQNPFGLTESVLKQCSNEIIESLTWLKDTTLECSRFFKAYENLLQSLLTLKKYKPSKRTNKIYTKSHYFVRDLQTHLVNSKGLGGTRLGEGGYGVVKKVKVLGETYALKKIKSDRREGLSSSFLREVSICMTLDHPNIIKLIYINTQLNGIFLDVATSDLEDWAAGTVMDSQLQHILAEQMFSALEYIQNMGCIHRDIKPKNILVFDGNIPTFVLADFGLARGTEIPVKDNAFTAGVVTRSYRPPELLLQVPKYNFTIDIWSMGCTLYEVVMRKILFESWSEVEQLIKIFKTMGSPSDATWKTSFNTAKYDTEFRGRVQDPNKFTDPAMCNMYQVLIPLCLTVDPSSRPSASDLYRDIVLSMDD